MAIILVVDDLAANREVLVSLLRCEGHVLVEAGDGGAALEAVKSRRPDLVITDVLMPVMDGYEFTRQLRLDPTTRDLPVIFYSAHYGKREARALAQSVGVSDVLTKPVESDEVLRVVGRLLAGGSGPPVPPGAHPLAPEFDREHLRLLTDKLSDKTRDLAKANARLSALVNIGLELASENDPDRMLQQVCVAARDLFGASWVTVGILNRKSGSLERLVADGITCELWMAPGDTATGILNRAMSERRILRGENPGGDPVRLGLPPGHPAIHAYLVAPIASPTHVYGWICFAGNEGRSFSPEDDSLVMALSGNIGRTYEHAYFYQMAERERVRAQRYLDTAEVILLALDPSGRITQINRYACAMLGWSAEELLGRDWLDTCLPVRIREHMRQVLHNLIQGDLSVVVNPVMTRSGEERMIEWRNTLMRDEAGNLVGVVSCGTDITDRHGAAAALQVAEERMRFALQNANVGIWDQDYLTGELIWSETLEAHYGFKPGTFPGTFEAFVGAIHPDDRTSVLETVGHAMKSGADFTVHNRAVWPDGTIRWLTGAGRVMLGADGKPARGVGISLDVTERHVLEAQFQHSQKMEAVGRLAGGVAHDFNNLLTGILGYCELLLGEIPADAPYRADIAEIQNAGTRAAGLTRQLLAFSRKQIIEPALLDLSRIVREMDPMLRRLLGEDIEVVLHLDPAPAPVLADRGQVEQVVMNLAVNSRDAMPRGGTLTIETADVVLDEHYAKGHLGVEPGPYVVLTMTDTGTGMTPEVKSRLFEPFFTTKEVGKGTGLGLATVHGIVTGTGGSIGVYSEPGIGTAFKVYIPQTGAAEPGAESQLAEAAPRSGTRTVLVVEDEASLRDLTKRLLELQGYAVLVAADAAEALRLFEEHDSIDVLLTDVVMPGASGPELTRQLMERKPELTVIYMSGYTEDAIVHHGVLAPGMALLHKPFTSEALGRKIRDTLKR